VTVGFLMQSPEPTLTLALFLDYCGIAVGAVSGALAAGRRQLDLVGVAVVATVTAIGGGTIRDLLLARHPVLWIANPDMLLVILGAAVATMAWTRYAPPPFKALLYADALALGLFAVAGARIAENAGQSGIVVIVMSMITAVAGGIIRDVLCTQVPLVMRSGSLYATAAIAGASTWVLLRHFGLAPEPVAAISTAVTIGLRVIGIIWDVRLPVYRVNHPEGP